MEDQTTLSKKERWELKREAKFAARASSARQKQLKKTVLRTLGIGLITIFFGWLIWYGVTRPETPETEIVARTGIHWHPKLEIYVKGAKQEIPANIGLGAAHLPIHTHDSDNMLGIIHMEFQGLVRRENTKLGQFFENWGRDMRSFGENMRMTVNGKENTEYENYEMRDGDKIELYYE